MAELMPPASLAPSDTDVALLPEQFKKIAFFAGLQKVPDPQKFPGTLILRFFEKGEVICRQGEAGWSAFYTLSDQDALKVLQDYLTAGAREGEKGRIEREIARLTSLQGKPEQEAASVFLAIPRPQEEKQSWLPSGALRWLTQKFFGPKTTAPQRPLYIPIDGPTDISYETQLGSIRDGDLFGEMSSLYGTPRSATVAASRHLYALEMLRNILDTVKSDAAFKKRMDDIYRERVLKMHLAGLPLFRDLPEEQLARVRQSAELLRFKGGEVICDEYDRSDSMYIIRSGLVRVLKNASSLLTVGNVLDWNKLKAGLGEGPQGGCGGAIPPTAPPGGAATAPQTALAKLLSPAFRERLAGSLQEPADRTEVVHGLNELIKNRKLPEVKELQELAKSPRLAAHRPQPARVADWPDLELREFNRLLLEEALPETLASLKRGKGPLTILAYQGRGEFFGEMGVFLKQPRGASCVAYVHPLPEGGGPPPVYLRQGDLVEMVRIPEQTVRELVEASPTLRTGLEKEIARRQSENVQRLQAPTWDDPRQVQASERFSELGLVQGQRLMLIDLDRCTRCDECVKACVDTHTDGRSRLFLDGPRFGKYLVPTTCRSCLEPVCMIGCPVGSIHRGDNRQIVIEDWCIGCDACARNCPYGSIQMHDIGLIPNEARDWHFLPAEAVQGASWQQPAYHSAHWLTGKAPFVNDPDLQAQLRSRRGENSPGANPAGEQTLCFRREFQVSRETVEQAREYKCVILSTDETASVWINGQEIAIEEKAKRDGSRTFTIAQNAGTVRVGRNAVAVRMKSKPDQAGPLFDFRLDDVRVPVLPSGIVGEHTEKVATQLAVVCDLCSNQRGQRPACVTACPHDAAMRVDARFDFPEQ